MSRLNAGGEARVGVTEVLGHLVECAALVDQEGREGVTQIVRAEVANSGGLKRVDFSGLQDLSPWFARRFAGPCPLLSASRDVAAGD